VEVMTLRRPAVCAGCGKALPAGSKARYYARDKIYCETHDKPGEPPAGEPPALWPGDNTREIIDHFLDRLIALIYEFKDTLSR